MKGLRRFGGFTLIEFVMVILLLAILATVAIPNFQDFRTDARNAAIQGSLGGVRTSISVARAAIALREDNTVPLYPTVVEMQLNTYDGSHPVLSAASAVNKNIMDATGAIPVNPWSLITVPIAQQASVFDCSTLTKNFVRSSADQTDFGWCYNQTTGTIWANSDRNGSSTTENNY